MKRAFFLGLLLVVAASGCVQQGQGAMGVEALFCPQDAGVDVFFCPQDGCAARLAEKFDSAQGSILVAVYSFTNPELEEALARARERGVAVRVLLDEGQAQSQYSQWEELMNALVAVKKLGKERGVMHHKFAVIDGREVATGSFNYSKNADTYNNENLVFLQGEGIAGQYAVEFERLWEGA